MLAELEEKRIEQEKEEHRKKVSLFLPKLLCCFDVPWGVSTPIGKEKI